MVATFDKTTVLEKYGCVIYVCETRSKDPKIEPFFRVMCFYNNMPIAIECVYRCNKLPGALRDIEEYAEQHRDKAKNPFFR